MQIFCKDKLLSSAHDTPSPTLQEARNPTPPESLRMLADAKTQICRIHRLPDFLTHQNLVIMHAI